MCSRSGYTGEDSAAFLDDALGLRTPPTYARKKRSLTSPGLDSGNGPFNFQPSRPAASTLAVPKAIRLTSTAHNNFLQRLDATSSMGDMDGLLCEETEFESLPSTPAPPLGEKLNMPRCSQDEACTPRPSFAKKMSRVASLNQWMGRASSGSMDEPEVKTPDSKCGRRPATSAHASTTTDSDCEMAESTPQVDGTGARDAFVEQLYTAFCQQSQPPAACADKHMVAFGKLVAGQMQAAQAGLMTQPWLPGGDRQRGGTQPTRNTPAASSLQKKGSFSF